MSICLLTYEGQLLGTPLEGEWEQTTVRELREQQGAGLSTLGGMADDDIIRYADNETCRRQMSEFGMAFAFVVTLSLAGYWLSKR